MTFGEKLRGLRKEKGYSQEEMAGLLDPVFRGDVLQKRYFALAGEPLFSGGGHPACGWDIPLFLFPVYRACPDTPGK